MTKLKLEVSKSDGSSAGPLLTTFSGVYPPAGTSLNVYKRKGDDQFYVYGENDKMEYAGDLKSSAHFSSACGYAIGIFDKERKKVILRQVPLVHIDQSVKAVKSVLASSNLQTRISTGDRRSLGETFGTRKAQSAIKAYDRGKIEIGNMKSVAGHITNAIEVKAETLQAPSEIEQDADQNRLIPPFDKDTASVESIYKIYDIMSERALDSIDVDAFLALQQQDFTEMSQSGKYSTFVLRRLQISANRNDKKRIKYLACLNYMIKLAKMKDAVLNRRGEFYTIMANIPGEVENELFTKFTDSKPGRKEGASRLTLPTAKKILLNSYICALALHVDNFSVDLSSLSVDLELTQTKMADLFRQLGCQVETKKLEGKVLRHAKLVAPVQFPKPRKGPAGRR